MKLQQDLMLIDGATSSVTSEEVPNGDCDLLIIQISGCGSASELYVEGISNIDSGEWHELFAINQTTLDVSTKIEADGLYQIASEGMSKVRIRVVSVSSGHSLSAYAKFLNTAR